MASIPIFLHFTATMILLLVLAAFAAAQTPQNITLGSFLNPLGGTTSWASPSGEFAVGFRSLESDGSLFVLAVWLVTVPNQTVVWVANRNTPVQAGSKLELSNDGRLVLTDPAGKEVWTPGAGAENVTYAAMLDSGNFVLVRAGSSDYAWESFGAPMDTLLPSQVLRLGSQVTSRLMESDYSDGRFQLRVQTDGNLVFYPSAVPSCPSGTNCAPYDAYYSTDTVGAGDRLVFGNTGDVYFALKNKSTVPISLAAESYSTREFYHRATLDPDGVLRHYVYPKNGTGAGRQDGLWTVAASLPSNICVRIRNGFGSGVCGFNSYCNGSDATSQILTCECPPQYSFVDPDRKYKGCKPDFAPQSCATDGGGTSPTVPFQIVRQPSLDWPLSDYEHLQPTTEDECSSACLTDCFCVVAIHRGNECWKKKLPLSNGRLDMTDGGTALLKISRGNNSNTLEPPSPNPYFTVERNGRTWLLVLLGSINCLLLAAIFLLACCCCHKKMHNKLQKEPNKLGTVEKKNACT